jgi:PadR family transcriptional regulator, regulatory protein PadR
MPSKIPQDEKWRSQLRKGFLELCVLSLVEAKTRVYGFEMLESLRLSGLDISEGTLYPLLARLDQEGSLSHQWETPDSGHPRKFYSLSSEGGTMLEAMSGEYENQYLIYRRVKGAQA